MATALRKLNGICEKRNTVPILSNVLVECVGGIASLTVTDMDMCAVVQIPVAASSGGVCTLPYNQLLSLLDAVGGGDIDIQSDGQDGTIRQGGLSVNLIGLPAEDFPRFVMGEAEFRFVITAPQLWALLDNVRHAISLEETRYYLNGICLKAVGGSLESVATDGHRLAKVVMPLPDAAGLPASIMPRATVNRLLNLLHDEVAVDVVVNPRGNRASFQIGDLLLMTKLIDGTFPDYENVIPQRGDKTFRLDRNNLVNTIRRVTSLSNERSVPVTFRCSPDGISVGCKDPCFGSATETVGSCYEGDAADITFQARYILAALENVRGDVEVNFKQSHSAPASLRQVGDNSRLFILMPMWSAA